MPNSYNSVPTKVQGVDTVDQTSWNNMAQDLAYFQEVVLGTNAQKIASGAFTKIAIPGGPSATDGVTLGTRGELFADSSGTTYLTQNCQFDGTNFSQPDTTRISIAIVFNDNSGGNQITLYFKNSGSTTWTYTGWDKQINLLNSGGAGFSGPISATSFTGPLSGNQSGGSVSATSITASAAITIIDPNTTAVAGPAFGITRNGSSEYQRFEDNATFSFNNQASLGTMQFNAGTSITGLTNVYNFQQLYGSNLLGISASGKITGKGFYDSGIVYGLASGASVTLTTGFTFGSQRFLAGVYGVSGGSPSLNMVVSGGPQVAGNCYVTTNGSNITVTNQTAGAVSYQVFAML